MGAELAGVGPAAGGVAPAVCAGAGPAAGGVAGVGHTVTGGMAALRAKSLALTDLFIDLVETRCSGYGLGVATPRPHEQRGSQVCLTREHASSGSGAFAIVQALIHRGVIGDFRAGDNGIHKDILRFGFTPLYIGFEDVWNAVDHLRIVLENEEWMLPQFNLKHVVT